MLLPRTLAKKLKQLTSHFPVVTITGPRQSGKTTCAKMVFPAYEYVSLEDPEEREFAQSDPRGFLRRFPDKVILDEIQRVPDILSYIQGIVDQEKRTGQFILTGSRQFQLMEKITPSLAGRAAVVNLLPFSLAELLQRPSQDIQEIGTPSKKYYAPSFSLEEILFQGLYPRIHHEDIPVRDWLSSYYQTYVERDVREIINVINLEAFQRFVRLCAGWNGQILNLSTLGNDCGISHTTARQWISILQAGWIIHLLPPHFVNYRKRLVKSPKLYFLDTGLLCYLLQIRRPEEILTHPMRGAVFESFVIAELYKRFAHQGEIPPIYFWRDRSGKEVDVLIDHGQTFLPIEIKSGETITNAFFKGIRYYLGLEGNTNQEGLLIYGGNQTQKRQDIQVIPWYAIT